MTVISGPVDAGKNDTVTALLRDYARGRVIVSLDDVKVPGVQIVRLGGRLGRGDALDALRRHDPDLIYTGDIASTDTAERALILARDGYRVLSTMEERDAGAIIFRWIREGIDPMLIGRSLSLILSQRRLPRLCPSCKIPARHVDGAVLRRLGFTAAEVASASFFDACDAGCSSCRAGRDGECLLAEPVPLRAETARNLWVQNVEDADDVRRMLLRTGGSTIRSLARTYAAAGEISVDDLIRAIAGER